MKDISYNNAQRLLDQYGLRDQFDQDPQGTVNYINQKLAGGEGQESYNVNSLLDAGALTRLSGLWTRKVSDPVGNYLHSKLDDYGTAGRVTANIVQGLTDSVPELVPFLLTRKVTPGAIGKIMGSTGTGILGASRAQAEFGDPTTSIISGVTSAVTPSVATRLTPTAIANPLARNIIGGAATNVITTPVIEAYTPRQAAVTLEDGTQAVVPTEDHVNVFEGGKAVERLGEFVTNKDALLTAAIGGTLMDAVTGSVEGANIRRRLASEQAKASLPNTSSTLGATGYLQNNGVKVPKNASKVAREAAMDSIALDPTPENKLKQTRMLFSSLDDSKLDPSEKEYKRRLNENNLSVEELDSFNKQAEPEVNALDIFTDTINEIVNNRIDDQKTSWLGKTMDNIQRLFATPAMYLSRSAAGKEVFNTMSQSSGKSVKAVNDIVSSLGQNAEGSLSQAETFDNLKRFAQDLSKNTDGISDKVKTFFDASQEKLRDVKNTTPYTLDEIKNKFGITNDNYAQVLHNSQFIPIKQAKALYDAYNTSRVNFLAKDLRLGALKLNEAEALKLANEINKFAQTKATKLRNERPNLTKEQFEARELEERTNIANALKIQLKLLRPDVDVDLLDKTIQRIASTNYEMNKASLSAFEKSAKLGYVSMSRRGRYLLSYHKTDGTPVMESFATKEALDGRKKALSSDAEVDSTSLKDFDTKKEGFNEYEILSSASQRTLLKELSKAKEKFRQESKLDEYNNVQEWVNSLNEAFDKANAAFNKETIHERSKIKRKLVFGNDAKAYFSNLYDMAAWYAKTASYLEDASKIDYIKSTTEIANNPKLKKYVEDLQTYINNPDIKEWQDVRGITSLFYLAPRAAHLLQNLTQVPFLGLSNWRLHTGKSSLNFMKNFAKSIKLVNAFDSPDKKIKVEYQELLPLMKELEERGVFSQKVSQEARGKQTLDDMVQNFFDEKATWKENKGLSEKSSFLYNKSREGLSKATDFLNIPMDASESFNRKVAAASVLLEETSKKPLKDLSRVELERIYQKAINFSNDVNYVAGRSNRPYVIRATSTLPHLHGATMTAMSLKSFAVNLASNLLRTANALGIGASSITDKRLLNSKPGRALAKTYLTYGLVAGLMGVPFAEDIDDLTSQMLGEKYRPSRKTRDALTALIKLLGDDEDNEFADQLIDSVMYGLPAMSGSSFRGIGAGDLVPTLNPDNTLWDLFGAPAQMIERFATTLKSISDRDQTLLEQGLPTIGQEIVRTAKYLSGEPITNKKGERISPNDFKASGWQTIASMLGGQPVEVRKAQEARWQESGMRQDWEDERIAAVDKAARLAKDGNRLRELYEDGVARRLWEDDPTAFAELVGERVAKAETKYNPTPNKMLRDQINDLRTIYGNNPRYLSRLTKLEKAIQIAMSMENYTALDQLWNKLDRVDLEESALLEQGYDSHVLSVLKKVEQGKELTTEDIKLLESLDS